MTTLRTGVCNIARSLVRCRLASVVDVCPPQPNVAPTSPTDVPLAPLVDDVCGWPLYHGERAELDETNPRACLCGWWFYLDCPAYIGSDGGLSGWMVWRADDGRVYADPAPMA